MYDFIIVGNGLAGNILAIQLYSRNANYLVISNPELSQCSKVAAGLWNPVVFKRLTKSWQADKLLPELKRFYNYAEVLTGTSFMTERNIIKPLETEEEQTLWNKKFHSELTSYISPTEKCFGTKLLKTKKAGYFGKVLQSGNIEMKSFLKACDDFHKKNNALLLETFDYNLLKISNDFIHYKDVKAKNIIFCEGYRIKENPFFHWVPLKPVKGEVLEIECPKLELKPEIFNRNGFIFHLKDATYKVGATYDWYDLSETPTENGLNSLKNKLELMIQVPYSVVKHEAGIRPASLDRRPILGTHPLHNNVHLFNGLGTKGVMLAPYYSGQLTDYLLFEKTIDKEVDLSRFYTKI